MSRVKYLLFWMLSPLVLQGCFSSALNDDAARQAVIDYAVTLESGHIEAAKSMACDPDRLDTITKFKPDLGTTFEVAEVTPGKVAEIGGGESQFITVQLKVLPSVDNRDLWEFSVWETDGFIAINEALKNRQLCVFESVDQP